MCIILKRRISSFERFLFANALKSLFINTFQMISAESVDNFVDNAYKGIKDKKTPCFQRLHFSNKGFQLYQ